MEETNNKEGIICVFGENHTGKFESKLEKEMIVNIEDIIKNIEFRKEINSVELKDIEFHENGKKIEISEKIVDDFSFIGLNNIDFIATGFYLTDKI